MATYTVTTAKHATLTANTVDTVTIGTGVGWERPRIEVLNRGDVDTLTFTTNGANPTVLGDDCYLVPAGGSLQVSLALGATAVVKLIAATAVPYSVALAT
jgi:hypothetical protein